jgi:restriction endonuclease S subunit
LAITRLAPRRTISSQPNINFEQIKQIKVILPHTKEEQKTIVARTKAIEVEATKLEAESETTAQEAVSMLLNELGINVPEEEMSNYFFKSAEEKTISFSVMPNVISDRMQYLFFHPKYAALKKMQEKYAVERLENVCAEPIRRGKPSEYDEKGEIKIIKTVDLKSTHIDYDNCLKVSRTFVEQFPNEQLKKNDILVSSTGYVSLGKVAVHDREEIVVVDRHVSVLRLKAGYDPYFVTYFLRSHLGQIQFEKWFSGASGQIDIWPDDLNQFILPESSDEGVQLAKQKEIADRITEKLREAQVKVEDAKKKWAEAKYVFEQSLYVV